MPAEPGRSELLPPEPVVGAIELLAAIGDTSPRELAVIDGRGARYKMSEP